MLLCIGNITLGIWTKHVTGSVKRSLIANPNNTYSASRKLTCEFGTTLYIES